MSAKQRRVLLVLTIIGLTYFCLFFYPNTYGSFQRQIVSADEAVTYPNVLRILTPGETFFETRANLFLYEDYHYGYPFYALSALVLLPVRLIFGVQGMVARPELNLLLLRQFISLLPMLLAAGLLVYLQTRFQSLFRSAALFIFLITIRGVVRNHIWWWHPDALTVLAAVLTIFFLDRDRLRLGRSFYLAALFCGLAVAIKLLGLFFFLSIPAYLLAGLLAKRFSLPKALLAGGLFVVIMVGVTILSNPFLFSDEQRARMVEIQAEKTHELQFGYEHDDPAYYAKGPQWWVTTLEKWYGSPVFLLFLFASLLAGCFWGPRQFLHRILLTWVVPYSIYLLYFVAVKPDHYWLPVMLPLFSCAFSLFDVLAHFKDRLARPLLARAPHLSLYSLSAALVVLLLVIQFGLHLGRDVSGNIVLYQNAVKDGIAQVEKLGK